MGVQPRMRSMFESPRPVVPWSGIEEAGMIELDQIPAQPRLDSVARSPVSFTPPTLPTAPAPDPVRATVHAAPVPQPMPVTPPGRATEVPVPALQNPPGEIVPVRQTSSEVPVNRESSPDSPRLPVASVQQESPRPGSTDPRPVVTREQVVIRQETSVDTPVVGVPERVPKAPVAERSPAQSVQPAIANLGIETVRIPESLSPAITVRIGRVDVRAIVAPAPAQVARQVSRPAPPSLEDYLRDRGRERSR